MGREQPERPAPARTRAAGAAGTRQDREAAAARAYANQRSAARQPSLITFAIPGAPAAELIARPFVNTVADPELRREAGQAISQNAQRAWNAASNYVGRGQAMRDLGRVAGVVEDVRGGRAAARAGAAIADYATSQRARDDLARAGRSAANVAQRAGEAVRDAGAYVSSGQARRDAANAGRSLASGETARDVTRYFADGGARRDLDRVAQAAQPVFSIVRDLTYGPWEDHERNLWERDYRRALGDEAGARQAAREANRSTLRAGVNLTTAIPVGGGAGAGVRAGLAATARRGGAELVETTLRSGAPVAREQAGARAAARAAQGEAEGARAVSRATPGLPPRSQPAIDRASAAGAETARTGRATQAASSNRQSAQSSAPARSRTASEAGAESAGAAAPRRVQSAGAPSAAESARERAAVLEEALERSGGASKGARRRLAAPLAAGGLTVVTMAGDAAAQDGLPALEGNSGVLPGLAGLGAALLTRGRVRYVPAYTRLPLALGAGATAGGLTNAAIGRGGDFGERFAEGALWGGLGGAGGTAFGELRWPSRLGPRRIETPPHFDELPLLTSSQEKRRAQHPNTTYHVTPRNFRAIDWSLLGSRTGTRRGQAGVYSQWNPRVAAQYADKQARQGQFPRIQPWRVGFSNPLVVKGLPFPMPIAFARGRPAGHWFEMARKRGHDGVIFENVLDSPLGYVPLPTTVYVNPRNNPPRHRDALFRATKPKGNTWDLYTRDSAAIEARAGKQGA